jgi:hypothetical protein
MDNFALKEEIKQRIDGEDNPEVLKAIADLLFSKENDPIYREKLISRALKADEDIKAGRVYTSEEFKSKLDEALVKKR